MGVSFPANKTIENVVLKFSAHRFPYVKAKPIHGSQKVLSETDRLIGLKLMPNRELESIILSFGDDVEVLEPLSLRKGISNKINNLCKKYETMQNDCTNNTYLCNVDRV